MLTLKQVNKALKDKGYEAELIKGKNYFYFTGNSINCAVSASVMVNSINQLSLNEWVKEYEGLMSI